VTEGTPPCRGCGRGPLAEFLDLGDMPLAGGFLEGIEAAAKEQRYPLSIHVCQECGLVQIVDPVDPDVLFQNYSFSSSTVKPLVAHFEGYAEWLATRLTPRTVVEFGCNDGILLRPLHEFDINAVGVDISENITALGRNAGLDILTGSFDEVAATALRDRLGPVDVVSGSNVFAHNDKPERLLRAANVVLGPGGHLCLEVMYAGDLLEQLQWDTLYHEHLTFYSLGTLALLLERYGFEVTHAERIPMHGGSLRVVAARRDAARAGNTPPSAELAEVRRYEEATALNNPATWALWGRQVQRKIDIVKDTLGRLARTSRIWAYGAAGKATMWVNACDLSFLEAVVDASPLRAGKLMPGTHTPIVFPDELRRASPDYVFVTAWNYADAIRANEAWYAGTWITPIPDMRFF
jgi:SAM-dependent methyltransferase